MSYEDTEFDHPVALGLSGSNEMLPVHAACHMRKTRKDKRRIAKAKRAGAKHRGEKKPKGSIPSRPFPRKRKT